MMFWGFIYFNPERQKSLNLNDPILGFWRNFQNSEKNTNVHKHAQRYISYINITTQ